MKEIRRNSRECEVERRWENSDSLGNSHEEHGWHNVCDPFRAVRAEEDLISSEDGEHFSLHRTF
jgi:hypothetical protein